MSPKEKGRWAHAIAERIADEWNGIKEFPQDAVLLKNHLERLLFQDQHAIEKLIGTGVIESNYFDDV